MRSVNRVMLIGHLAADPEIRETKSGIPVANFAIATNRFSKDENGDKKEIADFHRVTAWSGLAKICSEYLKKGMAVYLDGSLVNRSFEDKEGNRHYRTEIVADNLNILTWKKGKSGAEVGIEEIKEEEAVAA